MLLFYNSEVVKIFLLFPQVVNLSLPMQELRTAPSSSAMMVSATCVATRVLRSCRSHARVTSCMGLTPSDWLSPRWPRPCWAQRKGKWRSTCTEKMVRSKIMFLLMQKTDCRTYFWLAEGSFFLVEVVSQVTDDKGFIIREAPHSSGGDDVVHTEVRIVSHTFSHRIDVISMWLIHYIL